MPVRKTTNKMSTSSAPMRIQKPARGKAAVTGGGIWVAAAGRAALAPGAPAVLEGGASLMVGGAPDDAASLLAGPAPGGGAVALLVPPGAVLAAWCARAARITV